MDDTELASQHILQNVEAVSAVYEQAERRLERRSRGIEGAVRLLGRPRFLYLILSFAGSWIAYNLGAPHPFDPAPFSILQGLVGFGALVLATLIVITQNRQSRLADHRAHIDLQVNLLAEKKIAKLIALVEELRRDMPIRDRYDAEAEAMEQPADPRVVADALTNNVK